MAFPKTRVHVERIASSLYYINMYMHFIYTDFHLCSFLSYLPILDKGLCEEMRFCLQGMTTKVLPLNKNNCANIYPALRGATKNAIQIFQLTVQYLNAGLLRHYSH